METFKNILFWGQVFLFIKVFNCLGLDWCLTENGEADWCYSGEACYRSYAGGPYLQ